MTMWLVVLFWLFFALVIHPYVTYPILMLFWSILWPRPVQSKRICPCVTLVVAVFNEEDTIAERIENALSLDYPQDRLEIIIASDGSTDRTNEIVAEFAARDDRVHFLDLPRAGKCAAINAAVEQADTEIVAMSDAAAHFSSDVLMKMVGYFADPTVHCVVGKVTMLPLEDGPYNALEAIYWRYESRLRQLEALAGIAFVAGGQCMAVRKQCCPQLSLNAADDLSATMGIIKNRGRIVEVSNLGVYDYMDGRTHKQMRSRSRRVALALTSIWHNRAILNPFRHPDYGFCIFSHKIVRWLLGFWLLGMLVTSGILGAMVWVPLYWILFLVQLGFYLLAVLGMLLGRSRMAKIPIVSLPMAICVVSTAFLRGLVGFLWGEQRARWQPAKAETDLN